MTYTLRGNKWTVEQTTDEIENVLRQDLDPVELWLLVAAIEAKPTNTYESSGWTISW